MNAGRTRQGGRYRAMRRRRAHTAALTGLAALIAATFLLALAARAVLSKADCGSRPVVVNVAVSPEIGPAVQHAGRAFNDMHRHVAGRCAVVVVRPEPPAAVMARLAGGMAARHLPRVDAWIPDSGLWGSLAQASVARGRHVRPSGIRVARTALVIAMPRSAAAQFPAYGTSVSWKFLLPQAAGGPPSALGLNVRFPDPTSSGTGLVALTELQRVYGGGATAAASLADLLIHVQVVPASAGLAALVAPARGPGVTTPVTVTTEQAVVQFDHSHPHQPLAVRYPAEGSDQLSYPYLLAASNRLTLSAAREFGTVLQSPYAASYVRYLGFRSGNGTAGDWPSWYGLIKSAPRMLPQTTPGQASTALHAWQRDSLGSRNLILVDTSSAMAARTGRGAPDLEQALAQAAGPGLAQFPDSTQMGLWAFPSHVNEGLPYEQLVPIGPLPAPLGLATRRQQIGHYLASARPLTSPAPLYSTILAAYQQMLGTYQHRYANTVIVLTAGVDHAPGDLSASALLGDLHVLYDPKRPVEIVVVVLGRSGDLHDLQQIAAATGGLATAVTSPAQIGAVLGGAVAQQLCPPHCIG